jgi:flagellar hook assembly protein FlgD
MDNDIKRYVGGSGTSVLGNNINSDQLIPSKVTIYQNYPNPFNPTTSINYALSNKAFVSVFIYDVLGHEVKSLINAEQEAGYKSIHWNATNSLGKSVPAGMYIYTIQVGGIRQTRKMVLLK